MASISKSKNGYRTIQFMDMNRRRQSLRLGKVSHRDAEKMRTKVEAILSALRLKQPLDPEIADFLATIDTVIQDRMVQVGLLTSTRVKALLGEFLTEYVDRRTDVKPATKEVWSQVTRNLREHFTEERDLATISEGDAEDFKLYLIKEELASTTVHKRLQFARMFFRAAMKRKLIRSNPFAEVNSKAVIKNGRQHFVSREDTDRLMAVCDPNWQTIAGLCRYGGLRCPSEVLSLLWKDIDWAGGRITVLSPKTEHHEGKESREIPFFPELRPILEAARGLPDADPKYVVAGDYREAADTDAGWRNCNLRTQFERLVKRAGLTPWPRLFHALRASRETELAREYPIHVVTKWLGNTPRIALKHYLQVTDEDFEQANGGGAESGAPSVQNAVQQPAVKSRKPSQKKTEVPTTEGTSAKAREWPRRATETTSGEDRIRSGPCRNLGSHRDFRPQLHMAYAVVVTGLCSRVIKDSHLFSI